MKNVLTLQDLYIFHEERPYVLGLEDRLFDMKGISFSILTKSRSYIDNDGKAPPSEAEIRRQKEKVVGLWPLFSLIIITAVPGAKDDHTVSPLKTEGETD